MNDRVTERVPMPPDASRFSFWSTQRRRPVFLLILVAGLTLFLLWLPEGARLYVWKTLSAQRGLFVLLSVFAVVMSSLIWSAGQRLDVRVFRLLKRLPKSV